MAKHKKSTGTVDDNTQQSTARFSRNDFDHANDDYVGFWEQQAGDLVHWYKPWHRVLNWDKPPFAKWFEGGKLNIAYNCVDRHVEQGNGDRVAIFWEGEPGDTRTITYSQLKDNVSQAANALLALGVAKGDRVVIYLPMIPEAVVAMLACARIGAIHSVVFGGFSADSIRSRIIDAGAKLVITADGGHRKGSNNILKHTVDHAIEGLDIIEKVLVVQRLGCKLKMVKDRDIWWHDIVSVQSTESRCEHMDSEDPLFILYTSGTTGKPKGILHTTGGYITQVSYSYKLVFDIKPNDDVYWCTADVGWITGHSYIVYGPLASGATQVMYEGTPDTPCKDRVWQIINKYKVTIFYTAPTLIRTFMKWGEKLPKKYDLSSLRLLGTVGEPINPEAWKWYSRNIGYNRCPVVDTWWQTETGSIMISPLPNQIRRKPGSATKPLPGVFASIVDHSGKKVEAGQKALLALDKPWPSMARTVWGDDARFVETYWRKFDGRKYFVGDGAVKDDDGDFWILGRVDDTMNVSGHLLSTAEIESALVAHPSVAEAAVVGSPDELTGQRVSAFVILGDDDAFIEHAEIEHNLKNHVSHHISPIARPTRVYVVPDLPKTRSGKIMRRLLRDILDGKPMGELTTLSDPGIIEKITAIATA